MPIKDQSNLNDLLKKAKAGDREAKNELCRELAVRFHPVAKYRLLGWPDQDREDIIQDTLTIFLEKIDRVRSDPDIYTYKILQNKIGNAYQRQDQIRKWAVRWENDGDMDRHIYHRGQRDASDGYRQSPLADIEARDLAIYVREAIKRLPNFCQAIFLAIIKGRKVRDMWKHFKRLEPELRRNAFDKRIYDCRRRLLDLTKDQI